MTKMAQPHPHPMQDRLLVIEMYWRSVQFLIGWPVSRRTRRRTRRRRGWFRWCCSSGCVDVDGDDDRGERYAGEDSPCE